MDWSLKKHGDSLERAASIFVSKHLPFYEKIWALFIGHRGDGTMANMKNISPQLEKKRKAFAEHHYTVLESAYFMYTIACNEKNIVSINDFEDYRNLNNSLIAFYAYGGRDRKSTRLNSSH